VDYIDSTRAGYDAVAEEYAQQFYGELAHKPLDRALLATLAEMTRGRGPVADIGCGPGQVARYLHERGAEAMGIDLSPAMIEQARRLSPEIRFQTGDMLRLPLAESSLAGIVAFYTIIHIPPADVPRAFEEFRRVLRPEGLLLLSFHVGEEKVHRDEWWDHPVSLDFQFYRSEQLIGMLEAAGFTVEVTLERRPYVEVEHPSRRGYLLARK
jgi:SAM-dependent methyltransferase